MKLSTSLVSVKRINSQVPRSNFTNEDLEKAAQFILNAEGIINPIILRETSPNIYEVVGGYFEYYAATRAREIDPKKGEMVEAYILNEENEKGIIEQVELLRNSGTIIQASTTSNSGSTVTPDRLDNLEVRIETIFKDIKQEIQQGQKSQSQYLEEKFDEFAKQMPKAIEPLKTFNKDNLNDLDKKLKMAGYGLKTAKKIAELIIVQRKEGEFKSLANVIERVRITKKNGSTQRAISEQKMVQIVDTWSSVTLLN
ncbi:hypothetical protein [Lusitaniella coriacea]|uniref:ParB N-terminal domain-containing protein n=1 Tax=Lusitaniella coriacea TaxID=1983105 RepID=UPI003CF83FA0